MCVLFHLHGERERRGILLFLFLFSPYSCQSVQNLGLAVVTILAGIIVDKSEGSYLWAEVFFTCWLFGRYLDTINFLTTESDFILNFIVDSFSLNPIFFPISCSLLLFCSLFLQSSDARTLEFNATGKRPIHWVISNSSSRYPSIEMLYSSILLVTFFRSGSSTSSSNDREPLLNN